MGIYIPGIETPKGHNYVTITIWPSGTASYGLFDREENLCNFKSIKTVPVPPHGGLIDRDVLKAAICSRLCIKSEKYLSPEEATIVNEIYAAPTIIQEEEGE